MTIKESLLFVVLALCIALISNSFFDSNAIAAAFVFCAISLFGLLYYIANRLDMILKSLSILHRMDRNLVEMLQKPPTR